MSITKFCIGKLSALNRPAESVVADVCVAIGKENNQENKELKLSHKTV